MLGLLVGSPLRMLSGPLAMCACLAGIIAICGCVKCWRCQLRDCKLCKQLLRFLGHDEFDDFELMVLVHEAIFETKNKMQTIVQVTAGTHTVKTDASHGVFQQPLHLTVEQGTENVIVDLLDTRSRVLATATFNIMTQILPEDALAQEHVYAMQQKSKGISKPRVRLSMVVQTEEDLEKGLLTDLNSDVDILVRQQLKKANSEALADGEDDLSEMEILKKACAGPLELFEGLGKTHNVYAAVVGPPQSRRWALGIWRTQKDYDNGKHPMQEIDLLKVETVQGDPTRHHVFVINCFDKSRVRKSLTFRRIERARDVWVEIIHLLVMRCREQAQTVKTMKLHVKKEMESSRSFRQMGRAATTGTSSFSAASFSRSETVPF